MCATPFGTTRKIWTACTAPCGSWRKKAPASSCATTPNALSRPLTRGPDPLRALPGRRPAPMGPIYVVGAGGIGCAVGYSLCAAGARVVFVEANPNKVRWGQAHGVSLHRRKPLAADFLPFVSWHPEPGAAVILSTKCYDNDQVLKRLPPSV